MRTGFTHVYAVLVERKWGKSLSDFWLYMGELWATKLDIVKSSY